MYYADENRNAFRVWFYTKPFLFSQKLEIIKICLSQWPFYIQGFFACRSFHTKINFTFQYEKKFLRISKLSQLFSLKDALWLESLIVNSV